MSSGAKTVKSTSSQAQNNAGQQQQAWIPTPAAEDIYGMLAGNTQQLMQTPSPYFPGQGYVGPSELTQQGVGLGQRGVEAMYPTLGQASQNYGFLSNAADVANNPYVQGMIKQNEVSAGDWLKNQALPQLQAGALGVNALGSSRLGLAQGQAIGDAQKNLLAQNAATQMGAYTQGLGAQQNALGSTGAMLGNYMAPAQAFGQMGQTIEGYQQKALEDAMSRYAYQYQEPWLRMQNAAQSLQALQPLGTGYGANTGYGTSAGTSTQPNPGAKSAFQTIAPIALMAAGSFFGPAGTAAGAAAGGAIANSGE